MMAGPLMPGGESTSARLRRVEAERDQAIEDLAASEIACYRVEAQRDDALAVQKDAIDAFIRINDRCTLLQAELASARTEIEQLGRMAADLFSERNGAHLELDAMRTARDRLDHELAEARRELADAEAQIYTGQRCERCERRIRWGEMYEPLPGTGGLVQHFSTNCADFTYEGATPA
jgi:uncharacterized protein (DUF3084 family)